RARQSWSPGRCCTRPTCAASAAGVVSRGSVPATRRWPRTTPGRVCGTTPTSARTSVDFPDPEGPTTSRDVPAGTTTSTSWSTGRARWPRATSRCAASTAWGALDASVTGRADREGVERAGACERVAEQARREPAQHHARDDLDAQAQHREVLAEPAEADRVERERDERRAHARRDEAAPPEPAVAGEREGELGAGALDEPHEEEQRSCGRGEEDDLHERRERLGEDAHARPAHDVGGERPDDDPRAREHVRREVRERAHEDLQRCPELHER